MCQNVRIAVAAAKIAAHMSQLKSFYLFINLTSCTGNFAANLQSAKLNFLLIFVWYQYIITSAITFSLTLCWAVRKFINKQNFIANLESELSIGDHSMTDNVAITDEEFYDVKKRCGSDHVMHMPFDFITE